MTPAPRFIVFEGLDATGKSTLARLVAQRLNAVVVATPPAELSAIRPVIDRLYRDSPVAAQLFYASTVVHISEFARRLLQAGRVVVCDRYWLSTVVYDALRPGCRDLSLLEAGLLRADLTVLLESSSDERRKRLEQRGATLADLAALRSAERLARAFRAALASPLAGRTLFIDTGQGQPEACAARVLAEVTAS
jgi:dTMP kinase